MLTTAFMAEVRKLFPDYDFNFTVTYIQPSQRTTYYPYPRKNAVDYMITMFTDKGETVSNITNDLIQVRADNLFDLYHKLIFNAREKGFLND